MVTTLPDIHIALMGIERLVPTYEDLALMLHLLPRSATGQKLTVYASLIYGPRRPDELDGPSQRHLVLLDNGRRQLRQSPLAEALYCIRCGACLNACPVFREIGGHAYLGADGQHTPYPGPIGSVVSPGLFGVAAYGNLARASSLCGACKDACPVDIDLPKLLLRVRAADLPSTSAATRSTSSISSHVPGGLKLGLRLFTWIATSPRRFGAAQLLAGVFSRLAPAQDGWMRLPAFTGWGYGRDFPRPALQPFSASPLARQMQLTSTREDGGAYMPPEAAGQTYPSLPVTNLPSQIAPAPAPQAELVARFTAELTELGGAVVRCRSQELAGRLLETLQEHEAASLQTWDEALLPPGLLAELRNAGLHLAYTPDPAIPAGLTGALAGIAETGTLVLPGGPGRPLTASLLPEIHLAVLRSQDILEHLEQALRLPEVRQASCTVLITGPSRTADIEMTLTIGVHGPRALVVFIVEAEEEGIHDPQTATALTP
jgi:L-lactate dehydrogenase complex protein LldF